MAVLPYECARSAVAGPHLPGVGGFEADPPYCTGVVEKTATVSLGLKGFVTDFAFIDLEAGVDWVRNRDHLTGDNLTLPFVKLYLSIFGISRVGLN